MEIVTLAITVKAVHGILSQTTMILYRRPQVDFV
jgi:hypothetical protein